MLNLHKFENYEIQSEFCRAMASPKRLRILSEIEKKKVTVGELAEILDSAVSNISQHLRILKNSEIVRAEKSGQKVYYSISDPRIIDICKMMQDVISAIYSSRGNIFGDESSFSNRDKYK